MGKFIDLTGKPFGRLTVQRYAGQGRWECACECGRTVSPVGASLRDGRTTSCGCAWKDRMVAVHTTHGKAGTRVYRIWQNMKARCGRCQHPDFPLYGGRGVKVCERWAKSFQAFWDDFGNTCPSDEYSIDRFPDQNGNYEPGNVRWATAKQQRDNTRRTHMLTRDGRTQTAKAWAQEFGVSHTALCVRVKKHGAEKALEWAASRARGD